MCKWYCFLTRLQPGWNASADYVKSEEPFLSSTEKPRAAPASCGHRAHPLWKHVTGSKVFLFMQEMLTKHRKKLLISLFTQLQNHRSFQMNYHLLPFTFHCTGNLIPLCKLIYREMSHFPNVAKVLKNKLCSALVRSHLHNVSCFGCHNIRKSY